MKEIILKVNGMMCSGCENRIKNALNEIDGIKEVEASHETSKVVIKCLDNVLEEKIKEAIIDLGYEIED